MDKIVKLVNIIIIVISLFILSTQIAHAEVPCKTDRDCPVAPISTFTGSKPKRMRCRKGFCIFRDSDFCLLYGGGFVQLLWLALMLLTILDSKVFRGSSSNYGLLASGLSQILGSFFKVYLQALLLTWFIY
ncbi:hypothetical protein P8452_60048 [Trifolium repens]|nr:hypothetical protein P8452_60048 [Trifolium repens]